MQYSFAKACLLALATTTSVLAQIPGFNVLSAPANNEVLQAGEKFTIKWTPSDPPAPITLLLMQGKNAQGLEIAAEPIATSIDSGLGEFEWSVPSSAFAAYGILLQLDSNPEQFQYSNPFTIAGGEGGEGGATSEPTETSAKSTTTIEVSQISTAPTTSTTLAMSTTSKAPEPTTTSTEEEEEPTSTVESTTAAPSTTEAPFTTEAPSTTLETSIASANSTEAVTVPSATPSFTGAASRSAVVGSGILGAMVMVFALL